MSGYSDYTDPNLKNIKRYKVPIIEPTTENFKEYGIIYDDNRYDHEIIIVPWVTTGKRPLMKGTGVGGGTVIGDFSYHYKNNYLEAYNYAVKGDYITGVHYDDDINDDDLPRYILTREANYHPDGGQLFAPIDNIPFILLLALPTDDIKPEHFIGFKFDGTKSVQIKPNIWHQPVFPFESEALFCTKQGAVHACVGVDTIDEFNTWLEISLE